MVTLTINKNYMTKEQIIIDTLKELSKAIKTIRLGKHFVCTRGEAEKIEENLQIVEDNLKILTVWNKCDN